MSCEVADHANYGTWLIDFELENPRQKLNFQQAQKYTHSIFPENMHSENLHAENVYTENLQAENVYTQNPHAENVYTKISQFSKFD